MGANCCRPWPPGTLTEVSGVKVKDVGAFALPDGKQAGKGSWLYLPPPAAAGAKSPAVVLVHGMCFEGWLGDKLADLGNSKILGRDVDHTWKGCGDLAAAIAEQGIAVLMMGMPDYDEQLYEVEGLLAMMTNQWPGVDYARFLSRAIDHLCEVAPKHGLAVDTERIGLVGHSMGGGGVLCAAATDCKGKVAAVAALNPCCLSCPGRNENLMSCRKYATGKPFSGEFGEGDIAFLADISAPTFVYGSQAEYNTPLMTGGKDPISPMWPCYPSVWWQLGASVKELYVDNLTENPGSKESKECLYAHMWFYGAEAIRAYGNGEPLAAVLGFLRRRLAGKAEPAMARPANAKEWSIVG